MSEPILCPICETANAADATNCEVCGERLTPIAEGEVLRPEENVAASFGDDAFATGGATGFSVDSYGEEDDEDDSPFGDAAAMSFGAAPQAQAGFDAEEEDLEEIPFAAAGPDDYAASASSAEDDDDDYAEVPFEPVDADEVADEGYAGAADDEAADEDFEFASDDDENDQSDDAQTSAPFESAGFDLGDDDYDAPQNADDPMDEEAALATPSLAEEVAPPAIEPLRKTAHQEEELAPLPTPSVFADPATLTIYQNRQPVQTIAIDGDELLIGRRDPIADAFPEIDLTNFDDDGHISRKHAYIFRQNKHYTLYVTSNTGTQINQELLSLGDRRELADGDVIILAGKLAMKFQLPEAR